MDQQANPGQAAATVTPATSSGSPQTPNQGQPAATPTSNTAAKVFGRGVSPTPATTQPGAGQGGSATSPAGQGQGQPAVVTPPDGGDNTPSTPDGGAPAPVTPEPQQGLTAEALAAAFAKAGLMQPAQSQPQQPQQPQLSEPEMRQMLNIYEPTAEVVEAIRQGGEPAIAALGQVVTGAVKQAVTLANLVLEQKLAQLNQSISPALSMAQERQLEAQKNKFFTKFPEFKGMEPLLVTIRDSFIAEKREFPNEEAAFEAVAKRAKEVMNVLPGGKKQNPATAGQAPQQPAGGQQTNQQPKPNMPSLTTKGTGGSPVNAGAERPNTASRIFGRRQ